ncbi:MAG TPA: tetratricopeptide repeat protein [Phycisphaerae bacterium]|nr:tetratricopeptide repeat protein [Phycisphaerae bacterium]
MSYLLEVLGRGLIAHLAGAFSSVLGMKSEDTTEELRQAVERNPEDVDAWVRLGGRYLRDEDPIAARRIFLDVLAMDKTCLAARLGLACAFDDLEQTEVAIEQLRMAQKLAPADPAILFSLAYCHERCDDELEATNYYQDALSICPTLRNAHERLAAIFLRQEKIDLAIHHYTRLCELDPEQTDLHLTLASLLMKAGDYDGAVRRYEHALTLEPDNWTAHNDMVTAYEEAGLIREAIEHLHKMLDREPEQVETRLRLGDLYARIGNDAASTAQYGRAVELCPDFLEANVKLGTQHLRAGRYEEAGRWFSFGLELNDRLLSAYVGIGVAQHLAGRKEEALASIEMARNIEPNSTLLFSEVARMHLKAAAGHEANQFLSFADEAHPEVAGGAEAAGGAKTRRADTGDLLSQQIDRLREAIGRNPNHADLHYRLGLLLKNRGQIEDAIKEFRQAVAINPTYMKAQVKLGLALAENDQIGEAVEALKRATDLHPEYVDLHYQLGLLFAQRHQFEMSVEHYERAVEGNPRNVAFQSNLALALQNMGLIDRANASWQIVADLAPTSLEGEKARDMLARNRQGK